MYSAWLPGMPIPVATCSAQNIGCPRRHHSHRPQEACTQGTPTRSPTRRAVTPGPTAVISPTGSWRSEEHTSELQSQSNLVCRLLLEKKKKRQTKHLIESR